MKLYVDMIEQALRLDEPGKTRVAFGFFDMGRRIGVTFTFPSGRRHAVQCHFDADWVQSVIDAMSEWIEAYPEVMVRA